MALAVEVDDLGIAAGLMDRAVQAFGSPVLVDGADADHFMNAVKKSLLGPWPELEPYS
jgi:hypothetical protein